jgi:predicted amidohydrolase YtcJ
VINCYDSHVHWRATGGFARRLSLHALRSPQDLRTLRIQPENYFGQWLLGFGWDNNLFTSQAPLTRHDLDAVFTQAPVVFTRIDGHAIWCNTRALQLAGLWRKDVSSPNGGRVFMGDDGYPAGVFVDRAISLVTAHLPPASDRDIRSELLLAQKVFHRAGFTHIRDLTCDESQWQVACALEKSGELQLAVEQFFSVDHPQNFQASVDLCLRARQERQTLLRPCGVKVFFDGALGSEGAWLSQPYLSGSGRGLRLLEDAELLMMMRVCAESQVDLAVHVIGDEAAHHVTALAVETKKLGYDLHLHLEHVELLRPETLKLLRNIKVVCHMQPCHWLSDKVWLSKKIGELSRFAFQWAQLEHAEIPFYFGSDTPIEETSLERNGLAIRDAEQNGMPAPRDWLRHHAHPDASWCPNTRSEWREGRLAGVWFLGERV